MLRLAPECGVLTVCGQDVESSAFWLLFKVLFIVFRRDKHFSRYSILSHDVSITMSVIV